MPAAVEVDSAAAVGALLAVFPGSDFTGGVDPSATRAAFERLWSAHREGVIALGLGSGPHYDEHDKYRHRRFSEHYFRWPDQLDAAVRFVADEAQQGDVYYCPALRTTASRRKAEGTAKASTWLWSDVDGVWTSERQAVFDRVGCGLLVHSGRGRHVYVPLERPVGPERYEVLNRHLAAALGGEKWESNAFLRPPGSLNWKPWARSRTAPAQVVAL